MSTVVHQRSAARHALMVCVITMIGVVSPTHVAAQVTSGPCEVSPTSVSGADACQKARDLFGFVVPQIGVAVSAGNPVLGEGGTMGGWPKRAFSLRVTAVEGQLPRNVVPISAAGNAVGSDFGAARTAIPLPTLDAAIGIFPGIPLGLTNTLGLDALIGVSYLPTVDGSTIALTPNDGGFAFSYGLRLGALQESSFVPGLSVSVMRRKLPTVDFDYTPGNDSLQVQGTVVTSNTVRIVASKRIAIFGLALGVGRDDIEGTSSMSATVNETVLGANSRSRVALSGLRYTTTRNTAFANASLGLGLARLVAEYGWSSEGTLRPTLNQFGGRTSDEAYRYGSLGIAFRF